jgi:hypothetical protein
MLFNWDSANFALALQHYDVTQHRPHPPGYPYFVACGKLLNALGLDANSSLVMVAMLLSVVAVVVAYFLGRTIGGRITGVATGLLLLTSVSFWSAGEVALAYPALALFSGLVAMYAYRGLVRGEDRAWQATLAYGIGAGFRPDLLYLIGPLWMASLWGQPRLRQIMCIAGAGGLTLLWLAPVAFLSGGIEAYAGVLGAYFGVDVVDKYSSTQSGLAGLERNLRDTAAYLWYALYGTTGLLAAALAWWAGQTRGHSLDMIGASTQTPPGYPQLCSEGIWGAPTRPFRVVTWLAIWLAPILLLYTVVHIGDPGYVFSFLPAVMVLVAVPVTHWLRLPGIHRTITVVAVVMALLVNSAVFLLRPGILTLPGLRANDASLQARIAYLQNECPAVRCLVVTYSTYKHLLYYLPSHPNIVWVDVFRPETQAFPIPSGIEWVILTDPETKPPEIAKPIKLAPGIIVYRIEVQAGQILQTTGTKIEIR